MYNTEALGKLHIYKTSTPGINMNSENQCYYGYNTGTLFLTVNCIVVAHISAVTRAVTESQNIQI